MITVREAKKADVEGIEQVIGDHVDGYAIDVEKLIDVDDVAVAVDDGVVVGVMALKRREDEREMIQEFTGQTRPVPDVIAGDGQSYGLLTTGYVREGFIREGVGRVLLAACLQHASTNGVDVVCALADAYDSDRDARGLLDGYGFERVWESQNYWDVEQCSICTEECTCGAVLYQYEL